MDLSREREWRESGVGEGWRKGRGGEMCRGGPDEGAADGGLEPREDGMVESGY